MSEELLSALAAIIRETQRDHPFDAAAGKPLIAEDKAAAILKAEKLDVPLEETIAALELPTELVPRIREVLNGTE